MSSNKIQVMSKYGGRIFDYFEGSYNIAVITLVVLIMRLPNKVY